VFLFRADTDTVFNTHNQESVAGLMDEIIDIGWCSLHCLTSFWEVFFTLLQPLGQRGSNVQFATNGTGCVQEKRDVHEIKNALSIVNSSYPKVDSQDNLQEKVVSITYASATYERHV